MKIAVVGAAAEISRLTIRPPSISRISVLFSMKSPSGTRNSSPSTYPNWIMVTIRPAAATSSPKEALIVPTSGWA